jgi:hypothetical protein
MESLRKGLLCHAFWSLCFNDEEEEDMAQKPEEYSTMGTSLQGTALEEWQLQQKREKRAWLGLSFSDDADAIQDKKRGSGRIPTSSIAERERTSRNTGRAPDTIMISKVTAADKYIAADDIKYQMEDDVASDVSLDFSEPNKEIKGQRLQIKKKPPKVIQAKTKLPVKKGTSNAKVAVDKEIHSMEAEIPKASSKLKSLEQKIFGSKKVEIESVKEKLTTKEQQQDSLETAIVDQGKDITLIKGDASVEAEDTPKPPPAKKSANQVKPPKKTTANESKNPSKNRVKKSTESLTSKKTSKTKKAPKQKERIVPDASRETPAVEAHDEETMDESSVLPNPRFIPDFSERELKLRASKVPPKELRWKDSEDSRWEYYKDPRRSCVDHWWKVKSRNIRRETDSAHLVQDEARDPTNDAELHNFDSDSDNESYFDRYASGPLLLSPEEAQEKARKLAVACHRPQRPDFFQSPRRTKYDTPDELDDFAGVGDLGRPRRRVRPVSHIAENETGGIHSRMADDAPRTCISPYKQLDVKPVPPGVFQL